MKKEMFSEPPGGDQDQGWALIAVCWSLVAVAFVSTAIRLWIRSRVTRNLGWDDFFITIAMALTVMGAGFITSGVLNGLGRHEYYLTPTQQKNFEAIGWADWVQCFITMMLTKLSICMFLLRIVNTRQVRMGMYVLMGSMIVFSLACVFIFLGACRPLGAYWSVSVQGICLSKRQVMNVTIAHGALSIVTDLICAALPALFLRNLQISKKTKIGLSLLMGLGVITAACCTVRTALSGALLAKDASWDITANVAWRIPEVNIGIICANAPILRPLYLFFTGRLQSRKTASSGFSKQPTWPSNARREQIPESSKWIHESGDASMSMEMGVPIHENSQDEGPLK